MPPSRRPLDNARGSAWLGDPDAPGFNIEVGDDALVLTTPSGVAAVPWADIALLDVDIPTAPWWLAKALYYVLSTTDAAEGASSGGAHSGTSMRRGNRDITLTATLTDGTTVQGWAAKHQALGYPAPEAAAAVAVLQARVSPSG